MFDVGIYGQCRDFPDFSVPRRRPLENTTLSDPVNADGEGHNATSGFPMSPILNQTVIVDPAGGMDT